MSGKHAIVRCSAPSTSSARRERRRRSALRQAEAARPAGKETARSTCDTVQVHRSWSERTESQRASLALIPEKVTT
jgi:hypothetical protein